VEIDKRNFKNFNIKLKTMETQNYKNHRRFVFGYHVVALSLILLLIVSSIYYSISAMSNHQSLKPSLFILLISIVMFLMLFFLRSFALKAQDRAIRAEENFRHFILTGKPLDKELTIRQIVGLRFASDEEFPELAKKAVSEQLSEDEIKKSIKNWRPDDYRV